MALEWITPDTEPLFIGIEEGEISAYARYLATDVNVFHTIVVSILSSNLPSSINVTCNNENGVQLVGTLPLIHGDEQYGFTARVAEYNGDVMVDFADRYFYIVVQNTPLRWKTTSANFFLVVGDLYTRNLKTYVDGLNGDEVFKKVAGTLPHGITLSQNGTIDGIPIQDDILYSPFVINVGLFRGNLMLLEETLEITFNINEASDDLPPVWITEEGLLGNSSLSDPYDFASRVIASGADAYRLATDLEKNELGLYTDELWQLPPGFHFNNVTGEITGKVSTSQIKEWPFGVIAFKSFAGTNIPSEIRRFTITTNYMEGEHQIHWGNEDEVFELGTVTTGSTISIPITQATVADGSEIRYSLVGNPPKNLVLSPQGILSGRVTEILNEMEDEKSFSFMIQAKTKWTYIVRTFRLKVKKGIGYNSVKLYLRINNEYRDEYNEIKSQLNTRASYKSNDDTYTVDIFPVIDVATLKCFDREVLASMFNFGNPEIVQFQETRFESYSQVDINGTSIGSYEVYYKAIDEQTYQWDEIYEGKYDFASKLVESKALPTTNPNKMDDDAEIDFNNKEYDSFVSTLMWDEEAQEMLEKTIRTNPRIKYKVFNFENVRDMLQERIYVIRKTGSCMYDPGNQEVLDGSEEGRYYETTSGNYYYVYDKERNKYILDNVPDDKDMVLPYIKDSDTDSNHEYFQFLDISVEPLPEWKRTNALVWHPNTTYLTGQIILYDNTYYEVLQQFTTGNTFEYNVSTMVIISGDEVQDKLPKKYFPTLNLGYYDAGKNRVYLNNLNEAEKKRYEFWYKKGFLFWDIIAEPIFNNKLETIGIPFVPLYNILEDNPDMYKDKNRTFEVVCNNDEATITVDCVAGELIERVSPTKIIVKNGSTISYSVTAPGYFGVQDEYPIVNDETVNVKLEKSITVTIASEPDDATITLVADGYDTVSGQGTQSITVGAGTVVKYKIEKEDYEPITDSIEAIVNITRTFKLKHLYTLTIETDQPNSVITFTAKDYEPNPDGKSITVPENTTIIFKVACHGYQTISNNIRITRDTTVNIYFDEYAFTLSVQTSPDDATITFEAEDPMEGTLTSNSIAVQGETQVSYLVEKEGYVTEYQNYPNGITDNITADVIMRKYIKIEFRITPDDYTLSMAIPSSNMWQAGHTYEKYALVNYNGKFYNSKYKHTSQTFNPNDWDEAITSIWIPSGTAINYVVSRFGYADFGAYKSYTEDTIIEKSMEDLDYVVPEDTDLDGYVKESNSNLFIQKE